MRKQAKRMEAMSTQEMEAIKGWKGPMKRGRTRKKSL